MNPLPRWECRGKKDREAFEAWTLAQVMALLEPTEKDFQRDLEMGSYLEKSFEQEQLKGRVIRAAKNKDRVTLARLIAKHPELASFVKQKYKAGRPREDDPYMREVALMVHRIRYIWSRPPPHGFGRRYRKDDPTAVDIAARFWGTTPEDFRKWHKNHPG